jgi:hypothetical protein
VDAATHPEVAVDRPLWRAHALFRLLSTAEAAVVAALSQRCHPALEALALIAFALWSALVARMLPRRSGRGQRWLVVVDTVVCALGVLATLGFETAAQRHSGSPTLLVAAGAGCVLAAAVALGAGGGAAAAAVVGAADLAVRGYPATQTLTGAVVLLLVGGVGGWLVGHARRAEQETVALRSAQAADARQRALAVDIHDSVLQSLGLLARQRGHLGADEAARLAAGAERQLRVLVTGSRPDAGHRPPAWSPLTSTPPTSPEADGLVDVVAAIDGLVTARAGAGGAVVTLPSRARRYGDRPRWPISFCGPSVRRSTMPRCMHPAPASSSGWTASRRS